MTHSTMISKKRWDMVRVSLALIFLSLIIALFAGCAPKSKYPYNVCIRLQSRTMGLISMCGITKEKCAEFAEKRRKRRGSFPRWPGEGCFLDE